MQWDRFALSAALAAFTLLTAAPAAAKARVRPSVADDFNLDHADGSKPVKPAS